MALNQHNVSSSISACGLAACWSSTKRTSSSQRL